MPILCIRSEMPPVMTISSRMRQAACANLGTGRLGYLETEAVLVFTSMQRADTSRWSKWHPPIKYM